MNPLAWLNPARWLLYIALIGAVGLGVYRLDQSRQQLGYNRAQAEYTSQALAAEQAARAREQALQAEKTKVEAIYAKHKKAAELDAAGAADELERLRIALANAPAINPGASASAPAGTDAGTNVVNQLFGACAQTLVGLAREADGLEARLVGLQTYVSQVCLKPP